jgi:hypothetical protein
VVRKVKEKVNNMAPYGMPMDMGGDTKESEKWMQNCLMKVGQKNPKMPMSNRVAICKATYMKSHGDQKTASFILDNLFPDKDL